ncbi:MAG TPA: hypothetical protein VMG33_08185 [Steroidobacteraceae bacterium]|nr:hypothetical protein [Steroidobacteraceae bacterium]HUI59148.1 hypothetical protein [Steroidobacteraceae bacterium]
MSTPEIYCPLCRWRPGAESRWSCARAIGGCGLSWNTFETRGVCPKCSWHWEITQCLACQQFSEHAKWYHDPEAGPAFRRQRESELADA